MYPDCQCSIVIALSLMLSELAGDTYSQNDGTKKVVMGRIVCQV